jgi:chemotaxis protein MotA
MDLGTIFGFLISFALVIVGILLNGELIAFVDPPSIVIVVCGTFMVAFVNYPASTVFGAIKVALKTLKYALPVDPVSFIPQVVEYAQLARKQGILALEAQIEAVEDPFLRKGLQLLVDGVDPETVEAILDDEVEAVTTRHKEGAKIFQSLGTIAPAMGLIGTLIGLVNMLQNMDDPSAIGPAMAVALLTTFYGAIMANMIFNPMAGKLQARHTEEMLARNLIVKGLMGIARGDNPRLLQQRLRSELPPRLQVEEE